MKNQQTILMMATALLLTGVSGAALADCATLIAYQGSARIRITSVESWSSGSELLGVEFLVLSSVDSSLTTSFEEPNEVRVQLLDESYFEGEYTSLVRCEHDVCATLSEVDFAKNVVEAQADLYIDCPDAGPAVGEVRIHMAEVDVPAGPRYVPVLVSRAR